MRKKGLKLWCIAIVVFMYTNNAFAVMVTDTWTARISGGYTGGYNLDDMVSWTVTYDNKSEEMHQWLDGDNGVAERGYGDDVLVPFTSKVTDLPYYDYFADVESSTLMSVVDNIGISQGYEHVDAYEHNLHRRFYDASLDLHFYNGIADSLLWGFNAGSSEFGSIGQFIKNIDTQVVTSISTSFDEISVTTTPAPVPEPSTIVLLCSGLVGLVFWRKR